MVNLSVFVILIVGCFAASPTQWKSKAIYQLLTDRFAKSTDTVSGCNDLNNYCGGTFKGIINHYKSYIEALGFNAIWISPVVANIPWSSGPNYGYHGYWAYNLYEINSHFGSQTDLVNLANLLHSTNNAYLMIDVVANHMGYPYQGNYGNYNGFVPFNSTSHYHDCTPCPSSCNIQNWDYNNDINEIQKCRLAGLPDLNQQNSYVSSTLYSWIKEYIVGKWLADGIRIDTVEEVNKDFWNSFQSSAGVYAVGEVDTGDPVFDGTYQGSVDAILNYPMYYVIRNVFGSSSGMQNLHNGIQKNRQNFKDTTILGNFVDNHDNDRFLCDFKPNNAQYHRKYINALTFVLTFEGIPIIYYGTEQAFAGCNSNSQNREVLWPSKYNLNSTDIIAAIPVINNARNIGKIWEYEYVETVYNQNNFYSFTRGEEFLVLLTNIGWKNNQNSTYQINNPGIKAHTKYCNVFWPTVDCFTYNGGTLNVNLFEGESKIYVPSATVHKYDKRFQNSNVWRHTKERYYK